MKIRLVKPYKSLKAFESEELPDFTVITGKNGSGKTQLLDIIKDANDPSDDLVELVPKQKKLIQFEGLKPQNFNSLNKDYWTSHVNNLSQNWFQIPTQDRYLLCSAINLGFSFEELSIQENFNSIYSNINEKAITKKDQGYFWGNKNNRIDYNNKEELYDYLINKNLLSNYSLTNSFEIATEISNYFKIEAEQIKKVHFHRFPFHTKYIDNDSFRNSNFTTICYVYARNRYINSERLFNKKEREETNEAVSIEEYNKENSPPWEEFNRLLNKTNLNYKVIGPNETDYYPDMSFEIELINTNLEIPIKVESLSSGEQIVFGLINKLFISSYYKEKISYPSLIILDEPDAHLHPEMTKILIETLKDTFVKKLGIKVIITTHSPSTVALSPDESIFEITNGDKSSLKWIGRDKALELLTGSIPTLNIDYKNHKQVFVESPSDRDYYSKVFETLRRNEHALKSPLYFISNSMGKGNSSQVIDTINQIRESGNATCYGIIDWDQVNKPDEFIFVHGEEKRHTIENYLFDPIYISILFLINKGCHSIYSITGLTSDMNEYSILDFDESVLQDISSSILRPIEKKFQLNGGSKVVEFHNTKKINLPLWFLNMKHEELIEKFAKTYQFIENFKKKGEGKLQEELTKIVCKSYPMIPKDTVDLISKISNA